ncbi:malto-oligosyltrehalose trehalohydrolase [Parachryseolinea silvisoli]|uniref:malto-oligosyltrehalose trehalohydrolase n=1 Tax=Parachryseolinea silvisoli TaxID=2873601 RepID=UPI0022659A09|nr:malto-oligosyltrehalose trehalohydrolase [Parachryseolinea silvisoli]
MMTPLPGAEYAQGRCRFTVWAPEKKRMVLHLVAPGEREVEMERDITGYFHITVPDVMPGTRYFFRPDGGADVPDVASHHQPDDVHGASAVVDHDAFVWDDKDWRGWPLEALVLYELHVGTFTPEGTFDAIIPRLEALAEVGINALQLMPLAQFPGARNWGYDGVFPYAVQHSYGGPEGLKRLVNACHQRGIAVFLDVVYNHVGPEGNYFRAYAPYFTNAHQVPWGAAVNFDQAWSDGVRDFFINNAAYWFRHFHLDGLRLDAIHMVFDTNADHLWQALHREVKNLSQQIGRPLHLVAESDLNNPKVVTSPAAGGYGFDGQWLDDFHHALYALLHDEGKIRYEDYSGGIAPLAKAYAEGFVLTGDYVAFRKRRYGASSAGIPGNRFVVFTMNHDQVGNRVHGERLSVLLDFSRLKLAAAAILLAPYIPMLFMGEEYADETPFHYFVSFSDPALIQAVRRGRKEELGRFLAGGEPEDPAAEDTFRHSVLQWHQRNEGLHAIMLGWHKALLALRRQCITARSFIRGNMQVITFGKAGIALYIGGVGQNMSWLCMLNFSPQPATIYMPGEGSAWRKLLDSNDPEWQDAAEESVRAPVAALSTESITVGPLSVTVYRGYASVV